MDSLYFWEIYHIISWHDVETNAKNSHRINFKTQFSEEKNKLQKNSISKFPQPGVDEAMNCALHLVKVQGER